MEKRIIPGIFYAKKKVKTHVQEWFSDNLGGECRKNKSKNIAEYVGRCWKNFGDRRNYDEKILRYKAATISAVSYNKLTAFLLN